MLSTSLKCKMIENIAIAMLTSESVRKAINSGLLDKPLSI